MTSNVPVTGLDNISPLYNPDGLFQVWGMEDIYLGTVGKDKYVPKVNDFVSEVVNGNIIFYIVKSIDPVTYIPNLVIQQNSNVNSDTTQDDLLGTYSLSETNRVYLDKSVTPYRLSVDRRSFLPGSMSEYCKIFLGTNVTSTGKVISGRYDSSGRLITGNIPLENVTDSGTIKVVSSCYTTYDLKDGEIVTAVIYDADGVVVFKRPFLIENTGFIIGTESSKKYVSGISLETPFLNALNNKLIQYPINVPLNTMNVTGIVHYNDGSKIRKPIDGNSFSLFGLDNYSATTVGQKAELVLKYTLGANEDALDVHIGTDKFISEVYNIEAFATNGHYAVQLYGYPIWNSATSSYALKWYMYDLDRSASYDVTQNVVINTSRSVFNPVLYGTRQTLTVSINLKNVNGSYTDFNHVQDVDIILNKSGNSRPAYDGISNWTVDVISDGGLVYGNNAYATYIKKTTTSWGIRIAPLVATQADWLQTMYLNTQPMFNNLTELKAPVPTHFIVYVNGVPFEYPINRWNTELVVNQTVADNSTLFIKFIKRTTTTDLQLSIAASQVFQVDSLGQFI